MSAVGDANLPVMFVYITEFPSSENKDSATDFVAKLYSKEVGRQRGREE
jgi:hypothetical protein